MSWPPGCWPPGAAERDLRRLRPAGHRRAQGRRAARRCACREDLAVIGFDDVDLAEIVGPDDDPPAAARGRRAGRRPAAARRSSAASDDPVEALPGADGRRAPHDVIESVLSAEGWPYASAPPVEPGDPGRFHALFGRDALITVAAAAAGAAGDRARDAARAGGAAGRARRPAHARGAGQDRARVPRRAAGVVRARRAGRTAGRSATTGPPTRRRGSSSCSRRSGTT